MKKDFYRSIRKICVRDPRYKADAYEFIMHALYFTQKELNRQGHICAQELLEGARKLIIERYGPMAKTVLNHWGVNKSGDFGNIVFNMVEDKLLAKTQEDSLDDFKSGYDFEAAFGNVLQDTEIKDIA